MDPMSIALMIQTAGTLAQAYQEWQAQGAEQERLDKLEKAFKEIVPPEFDISISDPPELISKMPPPPEYSMERISPETLEVVGEFTPEAVPYIAEQKPELLKETDLSREGMRAQVDALRRLQQIASSEGMDPAMAAKLSMASRRGQQEAQSRTESLLQDMARRGTLGSGVSAMAQQQGNIAAMDRMAQQGDVAAIEGYENQLRALRDSASLGADIRGQEMSMQERNAAIINAFNQRSTSNYQNYLMEQARRRDAANLRRANLEQDLSERNIANRYQSGMTERDRADRLAAQDYERQLREMQYKNQLAQYGGEWQRSERDRADRLKQQEYQNQLSRLQGMSGMQAGTGAPSWLGPAATLTQAGGQAFGEYGKYKQAKEQMDRQYELDKEKAKAQAKAYDDLYKG